MHTVLDNGQPPKQNQSVQICSYRGQNMKHMSLACKYHCKYGGERNRKKEDEEINNINTAKRSEILS